MRCLSCLLAFGLGLLPGLATASPQYTPAATSVPAQTTFNPDFNLPKLGLAGGTALPVWKAQFIGRTIYREIQGAGGIVNDPLIAQYVNYLGHRLSSVAHGPAEPFHYFVIKAPVLNAFALPGAYIAVYSHLLLVTRSEDELAGVLAHETAHITLRHTARRMADSSYNTIINLGILLAGIVAAVAGAGPAGLMAAQGGVAQRQINYTRADEMEADHVGIGILARADFKPEGMIKFFQYMQRNYALQGYNIPEFLSTHPLDLTRISEAQIRAKNMHVDPAPENPNYALMRARLRVLVSNDLKQTLGYFKNKRYSTDDLWYKAAATYGVVLCLNRLGKGKQALELITPLAEKHASNVALHLAKAKALLAAGKTRRALAELADYNTLFASNPAVTLAYATALFHSGRADKVIALLAPALRSGRHDYNPGFAHLLARAADKAGKAGLSYLAMAHYYLGRGQYHDTVTQLRLGLRLNDISAVQRDNMTKMKKRVKKDYQQAVDMGIIRDTRGRH